MATHIFDIDGTLVEANTNRWLPGAKETLLALHARGDRLIIMTARGSWDIGERSPQRTKETILNEMDEAGVPYTALFECASPRTIHDDSPTYVDQRMTNQPYQ